MFHIHRWEEQSRVFTPPKAKLQDVEGSQDYILKMTYGFTSIELQCRGCADVKFITQIGDQTKA